MKSTGITRKIDELGRVVIPKEIRKNLCIREGESLEIITNEDNIILKKHSQIAKYNDISNKLCHIINEIYEIDVMITDREKIIASNNKCDGKLLDNQLLKYIDNRESYVSNNENNMYFEDINITGYFTIYPIIDESDSIGLIILRSNNSDNYIKLCKLVARIIIG